MPLDMLIAETKGMSDEAIRDILRYARFVKYEYQRSAGPMAETNKPAIRKAGKYKGKIEMSEDFDAPLDDFKEYM